MSKLKVVLLISLTTLLSNLSIAQQDTLIGYTLETHTNLTLPFTNITSQTTGESFFSDIDGKFSIPCKNLPDTLIFKYPLHRTTSLVVTNKDSSQIIVRLNLYDLFFYEKYSTEECKSIINKIRLDNSKLKKHKNISYSLDTYNKFTLTSEKIKKTNAALKKAEYHVNLKVKQLDENQHFIILESATRKEYSDPLHERESVEAVKSSGVNLPSIFTQSIFIKDFLIYDNLVELAGRTYISPLSKNSFERYAFKIIDTTIINNDSIFTIQFNPLPHKNFSALEGYLYVNGNKNIVQYFSIGPAYQGRLKQYFLVSYKEDTINHLWYPERFQLKANSVRYGVDVKFSLTTDTYIQNPNYYNYFNKKTFDETVLIYPKDAEETKEGFWKKRRSIPLSDKDSNTYQYFDDYKESKYLTNILQIGEHLYYGYLPYKYYRLDLDKLINFNEIENVRIGLGGQTNQKFSKKIIFGGYLGYGTLDQKFKYGVNASYLLEPEKKIKINTSFRHDLEESGAANFSFNQKQYASEGLRKYRLRILDMITEFKSTISIQPIKYLNTEAGISISNINPIYYYIYNGQNISRFHYTEFITGLRYAFGEKIIQLPDYKILKRNYYPIVYLRLTQGLNKFLGGNYSYTKIDFKAEQQFQTLGFGTTGLQLIGGVSTGDLPYSKLYNETGSFKNLSIVIHNSFETMRYNEFLSDQYISLFISHNFGRLYYKSTLFKPKLTVLHNTGFGSLRNPSIHQGINFQTMEKGYFESGTFINNIIVLNLAGLKTGIGSGLFIRYGPYANIRNIDNLVFKFSVDFAL